jgi:hypothetical protein
MCPPDREHRYFFRLYALDSMLGAARITNKKELLEAMEGHIIGPGRTHGALQPDPEVKWDWRHHRFATTFWEYGRWLATFGDNIRRADSVLGVFLIGVAAHALLGGRRWPMPAA